MKTDHHQFHLHLIGFTFDKWPVDSSNILHLDAIKASHIVQPLPAFDIGGYRIHPSDYEEKLAGAIACVYFTIVHFLFKQKHVFKAVVRDITVLCPPTHYLHPHYNNEKKTEEM